MAGHGWLYLSLVVLLPCFCSAFFCGCGDSPTPATYRVYRPAYPRQRSLLHAVDNGEHIIGSDDHGKRDSAHALLLQRQKNRMRRRNAHQDPRVTAAGAESLFAISWWSLFFSKPSTSKSTSHADATTASFLDLPKRSDLLPPIDCDWACNSDEERVHLQQMKLLLLLESELETVMEKELHVRYPDVYGDLRLLRFLRKSKVRDVRSSAERYRSFLEWRRENDVDGIRAMVEDDNGEGKGKSSSSFAPADGRLQAVAEYFPMNFDRVVGSTSNSGDGGGGGGDNESMIANRPAILYVGSFDSLGISEKIASAQSEMSLDDFLDYWIYLYESIHFHLYRQSIQSGEMMFLDEVCDLSGLSIQQFGPYFVTKVMKPWLRMTQTNYPETTRRIYILNPPAIINLAWKLVTPLLSQGTVDKIRFEKKFKGTADEFCESGDYS